MRRLPIALACLLVVALSLAGNVFSADHVGPIAAIVSQDVIASPSDARVAGDYAGTSLPRTRGALFSTSGQCVMCHTNEQAGSAVSYAENWRPTMLAMAARDFYWRATVRSEIRKTPALAAIIEEKCATCHTPMARTTMRAKGEASSLLDQGFLDRNHPLHELAMDGVSCLVCHQVKPDGLGEERSFSGGFLIETGIGTPRVTYGPTSTRGANVSGANVGMMERLTGYTAAEGAHLRSAKLCAACHTLFTPWVDSTGRVGGHFPEQMAYPEWSRSRFAADTPCQTCHMTSVEHAGRTKHRHDFLGANVTMLRMLAAAAAELGLAPSLAEWNRQIERTVRYLQEKAANIEIGEVLRGDGRLRAVVVVANSAGHKFPSGFPSRRLWIRFTVRDAAGKVLFQSGGIETGGAIRGNDNDVAADRFEPHYTVIRSGDEVAIYEAIMGDECGAVTTTLLRGSHYLKDNRLLPQGFAKAGAAEEIAVRGEAVADVDFDSGADRIIYEIPIEAQGEVTIEAELLFQTIAYRWARNLADDGNPEATEFLRRLEAEGNRPVRIAATRARVP